MTWRLAMGPSLMASPAGCWLGTEALSLGWLGVESVVVGLGELNIGLSLVGLYVGMILYLA